MVILLKYCNFAVQDQSTDILKVPYKSGHIHRDRFYQLLVIQQRQQYYKLTTSIKKFWHTSVICSLPSRSCSLFKICLGELLTGLLFILNKVPLVGELLELSDLDEAFDLNHKKYTHKNHDPGSHCQKDSKFLNHNFIKIILKQSITSEEKKFNKLLQHSFKTAIMVIQFEDNRILPIKYILGHCFF